MHPDRFQALMSLKASLAQVHRIGRWKTLRHVVLPQLAPFLAASARSGLALAVLAGCTLVFLGGAIYAYNPSKGFIARRGGDYAT